jgi:cytochrome c2
MVLASVAAPQDRADIIAHLRSLSPNPQPLP